MIVNSLRFEILDAMVDDWEDAEQVYLSINRERLMACGQPRELLVRVIDELRQMLSEGLIEAQRSWDETIAPLSTLDLTRIHYYWFSPTQKGQETWRSRKNQT
jgi:hypothetical protein